jgi:hypothetical protein
MKQLTNNVCKSSSQFPSLSLSSLFISNSPSSYGTLKSNISTLTTNASSYFQNFSVSSPPLNVSPSQNSTSNFLLSNPQIPLQPATFIQSTQKVGLKVKVFSYFFELFNLVLKDMFSVGMKWLKDKDEDLRIKNVNEKGRDERTDNARFSVLNYFYLFYCLNILSLQL